MLGDYLLLTVFEVYLKSTNFVLGPRSGPGLRPKSQNEDQVWLFWHLVRKAKDVLDFAQLWTQTLPPTA